MFSYIIRRLLWMIPTLFGITLVVFLILHLAPGDPATIVMGMGGAGEMGADSDVEARIEKFREKHLLNESLPKQYLHFVGPFSMAKTGHKWFGGTGEKPWHGILALDVGNEMFRTSVSVVDEMWRRMKTATIPLSLVSIFLTYLIAVPLGIFSAVRQGTRTDTMVTVMLFVLYSIPTFWAGLMLILGFGAAGLDWLPVIGLHDKDSAGLSGFAYFWDIVLHAILPVATMTYGLLAYLSRQMRVGMLDVIRQDYIRTARAKGLSERTVVLKHCLRNSMIPVLTLFASVLPILIGGSIIVETVFDIQGMGKYAFEALGKRDYNVVMATTTFSGFMTLVGVLLSDISYALVDPRIRYE